MVLPSSNNFSYQMSGFSVISQAYMRCGIQQSTLEPVDFEFARNEINLIFLEWTSQNYALFNLVQGVISLTQGEGSEDTPIYLPTNVNELIDVSVRQNTSGQPIDAPLLTRRSIQFYQSIPDKFDQGEPTTYFFWRGNTPTVEPYILLWLVPDNNTYQLSYWAITQTQTLLTASGSEAPGIPSRWLNALVSALAVPICTQKGHPELYEMLNAAKQQSFNIAAEGDADISGTEIIFDLSSTRRFR